MELDGSTFALEIINFLVLVWLLQHLFYKPVATIIEQRKAGVEKNLAYAQAVRTEAESFKQQLESRLVDWEKEKARAREQLNEDVAAERRRQMAALQARMAEERASASILEQQRTQEERQRMAAQARSDAGRFVSRLLSRLASAELEECIGVLVVTDLPRLPEHEMLALLEAAQVGEASVVSAYPMRDALRNSLMAALSRLAGKTVICRFAEDPGLMAGIHISVGHWVLSASLAGELKFFAEAHYDGTGQ